MAIKLSRQPPYSTIFSIIIPRCYCQTGTSSTAPKGITLDGAQPSHQPNPHSRVRGKLPRISDRGFLPWRLSDAGPRARDGVHEWPASETLHNTDQSAMQRSAPLFDHLIAMERSPLKSAC